MPIYMDRHYIEGATRHAIANAHYKDLEQQAKYGVQFLTYWFDEARSTAFCLVEAPDIESIRRTHVEAHGDVKMNRWTAEFTFDMVRGTLDDTSEDLPRMPPYRGLVGLR